MEYQHRLTVWDYTTGTRTQGVFRTSKEAENFKDATAGHEKSYTAEMGDWVYGVFEDTFDAAAAMRRKSEWMENWGGCTGRD